VLGMESAYRTEVLTDGDDIELLSLIGRAPDSALDVGRLRLLADGGHSAEVAALCQAIRSSDLRREAAFRDLLHGLELVEPLSFWNLLDARAVNLLRRSELASWTALCRATVCTIEDLRGAGPRVVDSTIAGLAKEWADAHLRRWGVAAAVRRPAPPHRLGPADPPFWFAGLSLAFERLEALTGFDVFATRLLPKGRPPTYRELAEPAGLSGQAVSAKRSRIRRHLQRQMRDQDWPITAAVRYIEETIGSLATPPEVESLFGALHRESGTFGRDVPHRRNLLLWLGGYKMTEEWVLSRDLDVITAVLLQAIVGEGSAVVDRTATYLTKLGVREHLHLLWLASQPGYRIVDGELFPVVHG